MRGLYSTSALILILWSSFPVCAQDLTNSRRSSYYTFIYKINDSQAKRLYEDIWDLWDLDKTYLINLHDTYPTDSTYKKKLPLGHYVFAKTVDGRLQFELESVNNINLTLLNNHRDLIMVFNDSTGHELNDVVVEARRSSVHYQPDVKAYRIRKSNKRGIISATYQGHTSYFEISRKYNNTFPLRTGKRIIQTFPINHLVSPIFYLKNSFQSLFNGGGVRPPGIYYRIGRLFKPKAHTGYMVFNKPKFKPNDTVRVKSFITKRKGKPIRKTVDVYVNKYYPDPTSKKVATLEPYRKGAYQFEFNLNDSLKLQLDNSYSVEFRDRKGHALLSSNFRYEDYELKQNTYSVRSDVKQKVNPSVLYLKGVDSNEMPLYDIRVDILLRPKDVKKYYSLKTFVPDTIWFHQLKLDAIGETKVNLPDSVMPPVSLTYEAIVTFSNSENEQVMKIISLDYDKKPFPVSLEIENDSLKVSNLDSKKPVTGKVKFAGYDQNDKFLEKVVSLPHVEKVNYFADWYRVEYPLENGVIEIKGLDLEEVSDQLQVLANRTRDSLFIVTDNPRKIPFRYFLFRNQKLIVKGEAESVLIKRKVKTSDNYTLSVQYIWTGKAQTREYEIGFDKRNLDIKLDHPSIIYPGQKASFVITVNDAFGKPADNVDLIAYAVTKKFESSSSPSIPRYTKPKQKRRIFNEFNPEETDLTLNKVIDWAYWKKVLGLDSISYYRFLFPDSGYFEYRTKAEMAQFAPFVVRRGEVLPVQVVYVDGEPVYYKGVGTIEPYSFQTNPGEHKIELRLSSRLVSLDKIKIRPDEKLIFSIDDNHLPPNCKEIEMPYNFTEKELNKLSRYFILVETDARLADAYLQQGINYHVIGIRSNNAWYPGNKLLTGPFFPGKTIYAQKSGFNLTFDYQPFSSYQFKEGLLKLKDADIASQLRNHFGSHAEIPFKDQVQTLPRINSYWKSLDENTSYSFQRFPDFEPTSKRIGRLTLEGTPEKALQLTIQGTFIVNLDNPDEYYVFPNNVKNIPFYPSHYQAVVIFSNEQYLKIDSIAIKPYGTNYYNVGKYKLHSPDSFSNRVIKTIRKWSVRENYSTLDRQLEMQKVRALYYQESSANYSFNHTVSGRIVSEEDGSPIPGVNVIVKGTAMGTVTDMDGYYKINCPINATLIFSFIGMATKEGAVGSREVLDVNLFPDVKQLSEVVVTGFGVQHERRNLSASVSTMLSGRVAGVAISQFQPGATDSLTIRIRGLSTFQAENEPLVIQDGKVVRLQDIDKNLITAMEVLRGSEATALYGSRGSNGVILISTRAGATKEYLQGFKNTAIAMAAMENTPGNSLRRNFRDYAFWKPMLRTDQNGKVDFQATFPDDINGWNAFALGIGSKKRSGQTSSSIQSYKPLIAQIAQPQFLIQGDSSTAIGKITHYGQDEINVERTIKIDSAEITKESFKIKNSKMDSIYLKASDADSISVFYSVTKGDYTDGELRKIPVYKRGVMETIGEFISMPNDTTVILTSDKSKGVVKLYAQANLVDVFLKEIKYLKEYPYECNEQLASRLWGLLLEKQIKTYKAEKFKGDREIEKTIKKLLSHQNADGSWSWWGTGEGNVWITIHVARCLLFAQKENFNVAFKNDDVVNYIEANLSTPTMSARLDALQFLQEQGLNIRAGEIADSVKKIKTATVHDKLVVQSLIQRAGQTPDWAWINSIKRETVKGNSYWGEDQQNISDNTVMNTLLVYKMMAKEKGREKELTRIRNYFLEQRKRNWRNTYESSLILETLLPGLIREKKTDDDTKLQLTGAINQTVQKFPFEQSVSSGETLTISKTGQSPIYFTAYQENWNPTPLRSEKDFVVTSSFEDDPKILKAGRRVRMNVKVEVKKDAEYVMIEVPIPAGCSYESKPQNRSNGEVYREYYNYKTNIYSQSLKKGVYTYSIQLLPRYSGKYTLNPAVAQCMYFPTVYGREAIKRIRID